MSTLKKRMDSSSSTDVNCVLSQSTKSPEARVCLPARDPGAAGLTQSQETVVQDANDSGERLVIHADSNRKFRIL